MSSIGIAYTKQTTDCNLCRNGSKQYPSIPIPIQCPKKKDLTLNKENETYISTSKFRLATNNGLHDPTAISTPPTDFMKQLKERMNVYFTPLDETK